MVSVVLKVVFLTLITGVLIATEAGLQNIALHAKAKSLQEHSGSGKAVDGNSNPDYNGGSCTHTDNVKGPWWIVDLESLSEVRSVDITNRADCCWNRLNNFTLHMSQEVEDDQVTLRDRSLCAHYHPSPVGRGATVKFACPGPVYARYVKIQIHSPGEALTLCEVKVWGVKPVTAPPDCPGYTAIQGRKYPALVLKELAIPAAALCGIRCHKTKHCYSFNVQSNGSNFTCERLEDTQELNDNGVKQQSEWMYFRGVV